MITLPPHSLKATKSPQLTKDHSTQLPHRRAQGEEKAEVAIFGYRYRAPITTFNTTSNKTS